MGNTRSPSETNLKIRQGLPETAFMSEIDALKSANGVLKSEMPNNSLYTFDATLQLQEDLPLSPEQLLLRVSRVYIGSSVEKYALDYRYCGFYWSRNQVDAQCNSDASQKDQGGTYAQFTNHISLLDPFGDGLYYFWIFYLEAGYWGI